MQTTNIDGGTQLLINQLYLQKDLSLNPWFRRSSWRARETAKNRRRWSNPSEN